MTAGKPPTDAEDWAVLARRGELSGTARAEFERALEASASLRVAHRVGRDFDDIRDVRAGDDELVLRASTQALAEPRARRRWGGRTLALAAALVAVAASATGATLWIESARLERFRAPRDSNVDPRSPEPRATSVARGATKPRIEALDAASRSPEPEHRPEPTPGSAHARPAEQQRERTAASLFAQASAARRAGELERARSLFAELQSAFPSSSEARVSRVSLGKLLLGAGRPREAEQQFRVYLSQNGDLREEALIGRAESFARLGQRAEERGVWRELLTSRPSSVYAARARERLRELASERDPTRAD